jgi:hypothetical protein
MIFVAYPPEFFLKLPMVCFTRRPKMSYINHTFRLFPIRDIGSGNEEILGHSHGLGKSPNLLDRYLPENPRPAWVHPLVMNDGLFSMDYLFISHVRLQLPSRESRPRLPGLPGRDSEGQIRKGH